MTTPPSGPGDQNSGEDPTVLTGKTFGEGFTPATPAQPYTPPPASPPRYTPPPPYTPPPAAGPPPYTPAAGSAPAYQYPGAPAAPSGQGWQSPPPPGYPPMGQSSAAPGTSGKKSKRGLIIGGAIGAVVLLAIVFWGGSKLLSMFGGGDSSTPEAAVKSYLAALADGDADKALSLGSSEPGSKEFLTNEILKKQIEKAPISDVKTLNTTAFGDSGTVHVSAKFGEHVSDEEVGVKKENGQWKVSFAATKVKLDSLTSSQPQKVKILTLFGKSIEGKSQVYVFPVGLDLASSNKNIAVKINQEDFYLKGIAAYSGETSLYNIKTELSDDGNRAVREAVRSSIDTCARTSALEPPGCPQRLSSYSYVENTAQWQAPDLSEMQYTYSEYDLTVRVSGSLTWNVTAMTTRGNMEPRTVFTAAFTTIDMTKDPLKVPWR